MRAETPAAPPIAFGALDAADPAAWAALIDAAHVASPYLDLDWIAAWAAGFANGPLRFHAVREGDRLLAALPLVRGWRTLAGLPVRALYSTGQNIAFCDLLLAAGRAALDRLLDGVLSTPGADILLLRGVRRDGAQAAHLRAHLLERGLRHAVRQVDEIYLDASRGLEAYRAGRRAKLWSNIRARRRRLDALGRVEVERHRPPADPARLLRDVCAVSMRSWKFREGSAIALLERFRRFLLRLFATRVADVWLLRLDGEPIAYRILATARGVSAEVDIGFDERHRALSPGTLLAAESNEAIVREGVREVSLGLDLPWKAEWSPERRPLLELVVFRDGIYPRIVAALHGLRA